MNAEQLVDIVVGRAGFVMAVTSVARGYFPRFSVAPSRSDTRALVYAAFLRGADVFGMSR